MLINVRKGCNFSVTSHSHLYNTSVLCEEIVLALNTVLLFSLRPVLTCLCREQA